MSYSWAVPGAKCVCINTQGFYCDPDIVDPVLGGIYTVRKRVGVNAVLLDEIKCGDFRLRQWPYFGEVGYYFWHFRPLINKSQSEDLAIFAPLLDVPEELLRW